MADNKRIDWEGMNTFTRGFKEWVLKLFRRAHARMYHIEEELAKLQRNTKTSYSLNKTVTTNGNVKYELIDDTTGAAHGAIVLDANGQAIATVWEEAGSGRPEKD